MAAGNLRISRPEALEPAASGTITPPPELPDANAAPTAPVAEPARSAPARDIIGAYRQQLWQRILAARPRGAKGTGTVIVRFRLSRDGSLLSAELAGSSGQFLLDRLALQAVRRAAPFPAPPDGMPDSALVFTVPLSFES
jgi:protein TonB